MTHGGLNRGRTKIIIVDREKVDQYFIRKKPDTINAFFNKVNDPNLTYNTAGYCTSQTLQMHIVKLKKMGLITIIRNYRKKDAETLEKEALHVKMVALRNTIREIIRDASLSELNALV